MSLIFLFVVTPFIVLFSVLLLSLLLLEPTKPLKGHWRTKINFLVRITYHIVCTRWYLLSTRHWLVCDKVFFFPFNAAQFSLLQSCFLYIVFLGTIFLWNFIPDDGVNTLNFPFPFYFKNEIFDCVLDALETTEWLKMSFSPFLCSQACLYMT